MAIAYADITSMAHHAYMSGSGSYYTTTREENRDCRAIGGANGKVWHLLTNRQMTYNMWSVACVCLCVHSPVCIHYLMSMSCVRRLAQRVVEVVAKAGSQISQSDNNNKRHAENNWRMTGF